MPAELRTTTFGNAAFAALRDVVASARRDDPLAPVTVVVASNIAGLGVRRHLAANTPGGVAGIHVTTLERLAELIAAGESGRPATVAVRAEAIRAALAESPGVFAPVAAHDATVRALARVEPTIRDLASEDHATIGAAAPLVAETLRVLDDARNRRAGRDDVTDLLDRAIVRVASAPDRVAWLGHVVIFSPAALGERATRMVRALVAARPVTVVVPRSGSTRADAPLTASLGRMGIDLPSDDAAAPLAGTVFHASDSDDEVRWVVREVVRELRTTPAERIAVLASVWSGYGRLLHEHFADADIRLNGPGVEAVSERPVVRAFMRLLELARDGVASNGLFSVLGDAPFRDDAGERVPTGRWERIARKAGVVRGDDWQSRLAARDTELAAQIASKPDEEDAPLRDRWTRERETTAALGRFVAGLRRDLARGEDPMSRRDGATWIRELFARYLGDPETLAAALPPAEQYAVTALDAALSDLAELPDAGDAVHVEAVLDVLRAALDASRPRVGRFGDGVYVGSLASAPDLDVDLIYVVGLAEDSYPGRAADDPLLPDHVRRLVDGRLPVARDRVATSERALLAAFAAPRCVATFARGDLRRSTERLPTRWLLPTLRALSGDDSVVATRWQEATGEGIVAASSSWAEVRATPDPATGREWRLRRIAANADLADPRIDAGTALAEARRGSVFSRYTGDLRHVADGLPDVFAGFSVSPTSLEGYARCPHAYFVERILRVRPLDAPEEIVTIAPMDVGSIIHETFDHLVRSIPAEEMPGFGEPWTEEHRRAARTAGEERAQEFEDRGLTGHPRLWARERERILAEIERMLVEDGERSRREGTRLLTTEYRFGLGENPPATIATPSGDVTFKGSVDRVDERADGSLVVADLKTGNPKYFTGIQDDPVVNGTKLQLPAYAAAVTEGFGQPVVAAEYRFLYKGTSRDIPIALDAATAERYAAAVDVVGRSIRAGLFPQRPPEQDDYAFVQCWYCNPDGVGHGEARERYEGLRGDPALSDLIALIDPEDAE